LHLEKPKGVLSIETLILPSPPEDNHAATVGKDEIV